MKMSTIRPPWRYDFARQPPLYRPTTFPSLRAHSDGIVYVPLFIFDVFEPGPTSRAQAVSRLFDTTQEARVVFEAVLEPVLFRLETDQHAGGLTMARNNDLLRLSFSKKARQIILDLGQRNLLHPGFPNCASYDSASE